MELRNYQKEAIDAVHDAWADGYKAPCIVGPCGCGKALIAAEMAKRASLNGKRVLAIVHRQELVVQLTKTFEAHGADMSLVDVMMVQTLSRRLAQTTISPALIITDENHHCIAASYKKIYTRFNNAYFVGLTATPVRLNGGGLGEINDKLIIMPGAKWMIDHNYLAPYDYYAPQLADLSSLKTKAGDYVQSAAAALLDKPKIYGDVIEHYRKLADGKQAICYCPTIDYSKATAASFAAAGITAVHFDGDTPSAAREQIVRDFRTGTIKILCNVDLVSEGFDVPDCEAAILLRPTKSLTLYIQQSMRCMRYKPGKRAIIIDHVGNVFRHGLPDMDRQWGLDPKPPSKSRKSSIPVRQCPECYYTHSPAPVCPKCGHVYLQEQTIAAKGGELQKITDGRIMDVIKTYDTYKKCKTMKELAIYAKLKGYKPGWAWYKGKEMGMIGRS